MLRATCAGVLEPCWNLTNTLSSRGLQGILAPLGNDYAVASTCRPAEDVGGDFYVLVPREHGMCVVLGDVCGMGRDAAPIANRIQPHVHALSHRVHDPSELLCALNRVAGQLMPPDRFVTAVVIELDSRHGELMIANAGHVPAMIRRAAGGTIVFEHASGPPLGMLPEARYTNVYDGLGAGDVAVLMTDGVLEAIETELTTMRAIAGILNEAPEGAEAVNRSIFAEVERRSSAYKTDDRTVVAIERTARKLDVPRRASS
jgi:two-component system, chemotaxis family, sensor kinase Cph1